ncbi:PIN domain nuclease, partial [Parageobacillus sp. SY1]
MVKRIVQLFFLVVGGTLGVVFLPNLLRLMNISDISLLN